MLISRGRLIRKCGRSGVELVPPCPECVATRLNYGGLRMRVWDGKRYGTGSVSDLIDAQVADAPRTVPEITPLSRTRNRKPI
jgi:hypothetical protein